MACDASIIPAVLGTKSELLDLGRTSRLVTPKLLQALYLRDRGCTFPGCSRPPSWCDAHHVRALVRRRTDRPDQHGAAVPAAPHDRAPEGLHRHRHRDRGRPGTCSCPAPRPAIPGGSRRHAPRSAAGQEGRRCHTRPPPACGRWPGRRRFGLPSHLRRAAPSRGARPSAQPGRAAGRAPAPPQPRGAVPRCTAFSATSSRSRSGPYPQPLPLARRGSADPPGAPPNTALTLTVPTSSSSTARIA